MSRVLYVLMMVFLFACIQKEEQEKCTVNCQDAELPVAVKGSKFSYADVDTVVLKKYAVGNDFASRLSDTTLYADSAAIVGDAVYIARLTKGYDWTLYIPAKGTTYKFMSIRDEGKRTQKLDCNPGAGCINSIASFMIVTPHTDIHVAGSVAYLTE